MLEGRIPPDLPLFIVAGFGFDNGLLGYAKTNPNDKIPIPKKVTKFGFG